MTVTAEGRSRRSSATCAAVLRPARSRGVIGWAAVHATAGLVGVTLCLALVGGFVAFRAMSDKASTQIADGGVSTSFGALWVDSFEKIAVPQIVRQGHIGVPVEGDPEKISLGVHVTLANTTESPVELTPTDFSLRSGSNGVPAPVEGATFESVRLLPGAVIDAQLQFPVSGGEHQLSLLFDDPGGSETVLVDLGWARFQNPDGDDAGGHH